MWLVIYLTFMEHLLAESNQSIEIKRINFTQLINWLHDTENSKRIDIITKTIQITALWGK